MGRPFPPGRMRWGTRRPGCVKRRGACAYVRPGRWSVDNDEMTTVVAHAAHAWLEASLFAPAGIVVTFAIARSALRGRQERGTKENP